jgi:hypothetical protein
MMKRIDRMYKQNRNILNVLTVLCAIEHCDRLGLSVIACKARNFATERPAKMMCTIGIRIPVMKISRERHCGSERI